jgi:hypothetical protein
MYSIMKSKALLRIATLVWIAPANQLLHGAAPVPVADAAWASVMALAKPGSIVKVANGNKKTREQINLEYRAGGYALPAGLAGGTRFLRHLSRTSKCKSG